MRCLQNDTAEFCLVEQILPQGPDHPFADNMLKHFSKLNSPIKSVKIYPTVSSQASRFRERGWQDVQAWTLWETWASDMFFTPEERMRLDGVECFDEWEELAIFGSHYIVLHASNHGVDHHHQRLAPELACFPSPAPAPCKVTVSRKDSPRRKFGATMVVGFDEKDACVIHVLGEGDGRSWTCDVYGLDTSLLLVGHVPLGMPTARVCHTLTDLGPLGIFFAGGRTSPAKVLQDCWLYESDKRRWKSTDPLPVPLYRHAATKLGGSAGVLVFGGKTEGGNVSSRCFLYRPDQCWLECDVEGIKPMGTFGAYLVARDDDFVENGTHYGILAGGISQDGLVVKQTLLWELELRGSKVCCMVMFTFMSFLPISNPLQIQLTRSQRLPSRSKTRRDRTLRSR